MENKIYTSREIKEVEKDAYIVKLFKKCSNNIKYFSIFIFLDEQKELLGWSFNLIENKDFEDLFFKNAELFEMSEIELIDSINEIAEQCASKKRIELSEIFESLENFYIKCGKYATL